MKNVKLNWFSIFSLSWISLTIINLFLIFLGWFNLFLLLLSIFLIVIKIAWLAKKKKIIITPIEKNSKIFLGFIVAIGIILSFTTNPTIFDGRDEGSYSISAIMMSETGTWKYDSKLINDFYQIYGPGKALNFPGFYYSEKGQLKSQFLPAYPAYLAIWYKLFGLNGLKFANLFPFITFIFSFFLLLKKFLSNIKFISTTKSPRESVSSQHSPRFNQKIAKNLSFVSGLFLLFSFPVTFFFKFTLSEIFFGALLWFFLYLFVNYIKNKNISKYYLLFIPLALLPFARIESFAILFVFLILLIWKDFENFRLPRYQLPVIILGLLFVLILYLEPNFFINAFKNILEPFLNNQSAVINNEKDGSALEDWNNFYLGKIFFIYNLLPFILMGAILLFNFLRKKQRKNIEDISVFFPFFILAPTLIYLFDANISLDHPWLLRRFLFSVIPIFIFYCSFFLLQIKIKNIWFGNILIGLIFAIDAIILFPGFYSLKQNTNLITYSQNKELLSQTKNIADNFDTNDLILISQKSSGSGWSLMSAPMRILYDKNAVYFFNPNDLAKIDQNHYKNIYLISSDLELALYQNISKQEIKEYTINNSLIPPSRDPNQIPKILEFQTKGKIYRIN